MTVACEVPMAPVVPVVPTVSAVAAPTRRRFSVKHVTRYQYARPVGASTHLGRLRPVHDRFQTVLRHRLTVSPSARLIEFEDAFGNNAVRFEMTRPYTELLITAESEVEVLDLDSFGTGEPPPVPLVPLVWMPWEQKVFAHFLTPPELPESQLTRLHAYAMSFVERNERRVIETLLDMNATIFREYEYFPGATCHATTPFEVFVTRKGVCQDFSNLFICLARLLGIPARYVCGYVFTGNNGDRPLSDASHAWVQLYLPNLGWRSFDPTNGSVPRLDHVRVAYGRHPSDATPTTGTLFTAAPEQLTVAVEVHDETEFS